MRATAGEASGAPDTEQAAAGYLPAGGAGRCAAASMAGRADQEIRGRLQASQWKVDGTTRPGDDPPEVRPRGPGG